MAQPGGSSTNGGTESLNLEVCLIALFVTWLLFFQPNIARVGWHARKRQRLSPPSSTLPAFKALESVDVTLSADHELEIGSNNDLNSDLYQQTAAGMLLRDADEWDFVNVT
jgi:hypothetical protein